MRSRNEINQELEKLEKIEGIDEDAKECMRYALMWADGSYHIPPHQNLKDATGIV